MGIKSGLLATGSFLGIGAGHRPPKATRRRVPRASAQAETEEEMRERHASERQQAGYDQEDPPVDPPPPAPPKKKPGAEDDDDDAEMRAGDEMPPDDDPDPDANPDEPIPDEGDPDDDDEDEDEEVDAEPDEEMRKAKRTALRAKRRKAARRAERARCARIFQAKGALKNLALAGELAFNTALPSARAIAILNRGTTTAGLGQRMAAYGVPPAAVGTGAGAPSGQPANRIATSWDAAMKKTRNW